MQPPKTITSLRYKKMWKAAHAALVEQGTWQDTDAPLLETLVLNRYQADSARALADASPFVEGSTGQTVAHPGFAVAARCDQMAHQLAKTLLLTPEARKQHGIGNPDEGEDNPLSGF